MNSFPELSDIGIGGAMTPTVLAYYATLNKPKIAHDHNTFIQEYPETQPFNTQEILAYVTEIFNNNELCPNQPSEASPTFDDLSLEVDKALNINNPVTDTNVTPTEKTGPDTSKTLLCGPCNPSHGKLYQHPGSRRVKFANSLSHPDEQSNNGSNQNSNQEFAGLSTYDTHLRTCDTSGSFSNAIKMEPEVMNHPTCLENCYNPLHQAYVAQANTTQRTLLTQWVEKFDSGCSHCVSGDPQRLKTVINNTPVIGIKGFNGNMSLVTKLGLNHHDKPEFYVQNMPEDICLLCAHDFAKEGAAILMETGGVVIRIEPHHMDDFLAYIKQFPQVLQLRVNNRTYEVDPSNTEDLQEETARTGTTSAMQQEAFAIATHYFNTMVNASTVEDRILVYLISGLTLKNLKYYVQHNSITGLHPSITIEALNKFEQTWGTSPEAFQLAQPNMRGLRNGYMSVPTPLTHCGQMVEADVMECDINDIEVKPKLPRGRKPKATGTKTTKKQDKTDNTPTPPVVPTLETPSAKSTQPKKIPKLPAHGGALYGFVAIDRFSSYCCGLLLTSLQNPDIPVKWLLQTYEKDNHPIETLIADSGVIPTSKFKIRVTDVEQLLLDHKVNRRRGEPHNHQNGTPNVERLIRAIKELIVMALLYILHNPNFPHLGFTKRQVLQLWGELFHWAIAIINLKAHPKHPETTRYTMYHGTVPNIQDIRLLPIFSVLNVLRTKPDEQLQTNKFYWQRALYVGPSIDVKGAIRAAVVTNNSMQIIVTTQFKNVSDGGNVNPYPNVERVLDSLIEPVQVNEQTTVTTVPTSNSANAQVVEPIRPTETTVDPAPPLNEPQLPSTTSSLPIVEPTETNQDSGFRETIFPPRQQESQQSTENNTSRSRRKGNRRPRSEPNVVQSSPTPTRSTEPIAVMHRVTRSQKSQNHKPQRNASVSQPKHQPRSQRSRNDNPYARSYVNPHLTRQTRATLAMSSEHSDIPTLAQKCLAYFADWSNLKYSPDEYYYSTKDQCFYAIHFPTEQAMRAVTENVPKSFLAALNDPLWNDPAVTEWTTIQDSKALLRVDAKVARDAIAAGADLVILFPVYEEKEKDGKLVRKVRLVANGKTHHPEESTYAATPNREEFFVILHLVAALGLCIVHIDEKRAFLTADYNGSKKVYTKHVHSNEWYEVVGALYGLRTSPKDYQTKVRNRLHDLGFEPLPTSTSLFIKVLDNAQFILVYDYVDDFIVVSHTKELIEEHFVKPFRQVAQTTEPIWDPHALLGMEVQRLREHNIILLTMTARIDDLAAFCGIDKTTRRRHMPMPTTGYLIDEEDINRLSPDDAAFLSTEQIKYYMAIVGRLVWISGVRFDICFAVLYLSWNTKTPRQHHLNMAKYVANFLWYTRQIPLVLGGSPLIQINTYTDSSLATGPKRRSISGQLTRLNSNAGAIHAKSHATTSTRMSSFEAELDATADAVKTCLYLQTLLNTLNVQTQNPSIIHADNQAMIDFVKGEGSLKGSRHIDLRLWLVKEHFSRGKILIKYLESSILTANFLTKLASIKAHNEFMIDILGLTLLPPEYHHLLPNYRDMEPDI